MPQRSSDDDRAPCEQGDQEPIVRWLGRTDAYIHRPEHVEHVETHISYVFLAGPLVYKLKKPVTFDFLDYSTVAARRHACEEEVRLNRRLAPDAYLGVVPIVQLAGGEFQLGGAGPAADWVVEMRRLPTELSLDALQRRGALRPEDIDRLAATLADFYASLAPLSMTIDDYRSHCLDHVRENRRELLTVQHHLPRGMVERIHGFQLQLLRLRPEIFGERVKRGRIVDGHGDLRPEHICLGDKIAIFDCIEFSDEFRRIDVADELAFLAAECDVLGAEWVGTRLITAYRERTGDDPPAVLLDFYKAYRACVRAKVAALRADQLTGKSQQAAQEEAEKHLSWADRYIAQWARPLVLVVGGLSGTGKTTLAKAVADAFGAELLRTDTVRQDLFGAGPNAVVADGGIYSAETRERVYEAMWQQAAAINRERIPIVLDGTFSTLDVLARARTLAADDRGLFLAIECVCNPEVAHARIKHRLQERLDASDARPEIHDLQRSRWQTWPSEIPQIRIDTQQPLAAQVEQVVKATAAQPWL